MIESKPKEKCPFCNAKAEIFETNVYDGQIDGFDTYYGCGCTTENCYGSIYNNLGNYETPEEAIEMYDRRIFTNQKS